jgi:hypothetical protein
MLACCAHHNHELQSDLAMREGIHQKRNMQPPKKEYALPTKHQSMHTFGSTSTLSRDWGAAMLNGQSETSTRCEGRMGVCVLGDELPSVCLFVFLCVCLFVCLFVCRLDRQMAISSRLCLSVSLLSACQAHKMSRGSTDQDQAKTKTKTDIEINKDQDQARIKPIPHPRPRQIPRPRSRRPRPRPKPKPKP